MRKKAGKYCIFDLDGVLVRECGVADYGYAYIIKLLTDLNFDS